jgi:hypothetical protein
MSALDDSIAALTTAFNALGTDVTTATQLIVTLQAAVAAGTATPAEIAQLATLQANVASVDTALQAVINPATPTPTPPAPSPAPQSRRP